MPYVSVDIDLDDLETSDLCKELARRVEKNGISHMRPREQDHIKDLAKSLGTAIIGELPNKTLDDRLKLEWLAANWDKLKSWDLEKIL